jgi:hypothetical protein
MVTYALKTMRKGQHLERFGEGLPTVFYEPQNGWVDVAAQPMGTEFMHVSTGSVPMVIVCWPYI